MIHSDLEKSIGKMQLIFKNKDTAICLISPRGKIISNRIFHCPVVLRISSSCWSEKKKKKETSNPSPRIKDKLK